MSLVRIHNFSISLDGFATGEGLTLEEPFGHAGHRLHEWMMATRFGRGVLGEPGGTEGLDEFSPPDRSPHLTAHHLSQELPCRASASTTSRSRSTGSPPVRG